MTQSLRMTSTTVVQDQGSLDTFEGCWRRILNTVGSSPVAKPTVSESRTL